jgi:hypothetical protein
VRTVTTTSKRLTLNVKHKTWDTNRKDKATSETKTATDKITSKQEKWETTKITQRNHPQSGTPH